MKKTICMILVLALLTCMMPLTVWAEETALSVGSGTCGENLTWVLDQEGVLTISGTGAMTEYDYAKDLPWYEYRNDIKAVMIDDGVTELGTFAFRDCINLSSVTIPTSVTNIGRLAFCGCSSLTSITIPASVTRLSYAAFKNCTSLISVIIPYSMAEISPSVFEECTALENVYYGGTEEDWKKVVLFDGNDCLTNATFFYEYAYDYGQIDISGSGTCGENLTWVLDQNGVLTISGEGAMTDYAFIGYSPWFEMRDYIVEIVIEQGVTTVGAYTFYDCLRLTNLTISGSVTKIGDSAFEECVNLSNFTIPYGVTDIGYNAFYACDSLTNLTIPDSVTNIHGSAFGGCTNLTSVTISKNITKIDDRLFSGCENLTSIVIPAGVTQIGENAFMDCTGLTSVTIPVSVRSIEDGGFGYCTSLTEVYYGGTADEWAEISISMGNSWLTNANIIYGETGQEPLGSGTCGENLTWVLDQEGVLTISGTGAMTDYDYTGNAPWYNLKEQVLKVVMEQGATTIGNYAFNECVNLTAVTIPQGIVTIGEQAFYHCTSLSNVTIPDSVTSIGIGAFQECTGLTSVKLSNNITRINSQTFFHCSGLTSLTIPEGVTSTGMFAFGRCSSLTDVTLPSTLLEIGDHSFHACDSLTTVEIPESVTYIGNTAFFECTGLVSMTIPDSVTYLGMNAFDSCTSLTSVQLSSGLTALEGGLFYGCTSLTSMTVPANITRIDYDAFCECTGLKEIYFLCSAPENSGTIFNAVTATAYYPEGDATWTEEVRNALSAGGNITWKTMPAAASVKFTSYTCSLGGNIAMNFYVELSEDLRNDPDAVMQFTYGDYTVTVPLSEGWEDGQNGTIRYSCPITSKNMADPITAQIYRNGEKIGESKTMDVRTYGEFIIANSRDTKTVNLMKALLNYGASAQMLFKYNTGDLANKSLSEGDKVLKAVDASAYLHSRTGTEPGIKPQSYTLLLDSETTIRVYFTLDGSKSIDQYTFRVDGVTVTPQYSDMGWYIECKDIKAQHLDEMHTFTCGGITITYSGMSYVNQVMTYYTSGTTFDMASALYAYWQAAEAYIA